jgi:hypothetical protein
VAVEPPAVAGGHHALQAGGDDLDHVLAVELWRQCRIGHPATCDSSKYPHITYLQVVMGVVGLG